MKITVTISLLLLTTYLLSSFISRSFSENKGFDRIITNDTLIIQDYGYQTVTTNYEDGKKNGKETAIFTNGDTFEIRNFKNNMLDGQVTTFFPHNRIGAIRSFKEGFRSGIFKTFDTLGNLKTETSFDGKYRSDDNLWSGTEIFYKDGKIIFSQIWEHGRRTRIIVHDQTLYSEYKANDISLGHKLFIETCTACHSLKVEIVGPALSGIEQIRNREWLVSFVRNGNELMKSGDSLSISTYRKYQNIEHPDNSYLTRSDIEAILDYIRDNSTGN